MPRARRVSNAIPHVGLSHLVPFTAVVPAVYRASPEPVVPTIPARGGNDGRGRMPAAVAHYRLPHSAAAIVIVPIHKPLIALRSRAPRGFEYIDRLAGLLPVKVPDVDLAVVRAGVDVSAVCAARWGEVAADQGFENTMPAEGDERAVVWVRLMVFGVVRREAVVEVSCVVLESSQSQVVLEIKFGEAYRRIDLFTGICAYHLAQIPEFAGLILSVRNDISPIALGVDICNTFGMPKEHACRTH